MKSDEKPKFVSFSGLISLLFCGKSHYLPVFLIILLLSGTVFGANINVLTNPGFESGTTGWSARGGSISAVTSPAPYGGTYCGRSTGRTATWNGIQQNVTSKVVVGQTYQISSWVRTSSATSYNVTVSIQKTDCGGTTYTNVRTVSANNSAWVQLPSTNYTLTANGILSEVTVYFEGPPSGVDIYVDDASFYGLEAPPPPEPSPNAAGNVNANVRYQTLEGFGAAGGWYEGWLTAHPQKATLYNLLFGQLGLDIYRVRNSFDQGQGGIDYMTRSGEIVAAAGTSLGHPIKILISSWSPPASLKSNGQIAGGGNATLAGGPSNYVYPLFADWWADSITGWAGYGVNADYVSMQNEPDFDASWDSCRFNPTQTTSIAGYDQAFEAVYNELYSRFGANMPKMLAPEATGFPGSGGGSLASYCAALTNPSHAYGYNHHLYNGGSGDNPDGYLGNMCSFAASYGSKPIFQTEYSNNNTTFTDAMNLAILLHNSLTVEEVVSYFYWDLFWETPGGLVSFPSYGNSGYTINPVYYAFKHFSKFTDPGWQRVDASTDSSNLRISSYISPGDNQLSVVVINTSTAIDTNLTLSFTGYSVGDADVYRSSSTQNCELIGTYNSANPLLAPANTITTIVFGTADTTPPAAPTGLTATAGESQVSLNWDDNSELDLAGYNVYRSLTSGGGYGKINGSLVTSSAYTDNNVDGYVTYYYVVRAVDTALNESGNSNQASATPTDTTPPASPTGLTALAGNGTVSLNWNNNGEGDLDGYNVYRSTSGSGYGQLNGSLLTNSDYIDNTVTNGITYYYVVTAVDTSSNESGGSSEASATPVPITIYTFAGITAANTEYNVYACDVDVFPFAGSSGNRNSMVEATDGQYGNISYDDASEWTTNDPGLNDEVLLWVEMKINEPPAGISRIDLTFDGYTGGASDATYRIYVLTAGADWTLDSSWTQVGSDQSISPGTYATMTRSITSNFSNYIDGSGRITWAVYELTSSEAMHVNYLETAVFTSVPANNPPTVSITTPANGDIFAQNANITIDADASDGDGTISKVEFYQGTTKLGEDTAAPYSYTWNNAPTGLYTLTTVATDDDSDTNTSSEINITVLGAEGTGAVLSEWWNGITGTLVSDLTSDANYPENPSGEELLLALEGPVNWNDNYGTRIRGYLNPVATGSYTFWIASDDNSELWLSTDDNPVNISRIAYIPGAGQSSPETLSAGQKYYIEVLHKEGTGNDNISVSWQGPGIIQQVIDGIYLSPCCLDFENFADFASQWNISGCNTGNDWCYGFDFGRDGSVTLDDLSIFTDAWLAGI